MGKTQQSSNPTNASPNTASEPYINTENNHRWFYPESYNYINTFSDHHFRHPDVLSKEQGGIAIWYPRENEMFRIGDTSYENIFAEHICRDENILHHCPASHTDFFYSYIKIELNEDKWKDVLSVSGSIGYDPLKHHLYARCGSVEANIASLYTCLKINAGEPVDNRPKMYSKHIQNTSDEEKVKEMYMYILDQLHKQKTPTVGYWKVAFPEYHQSEVCFK